MDFAHQFAIILQILVIDLSLAADNAIVIGMAAGGLPVHQRRRAVWAGLGGAVILRIILAIFATKLLHVTGLAIAGGLLLLWVSWKMYRDIVMSRKEEKTAERALGEHSHAKASSPHRTMRGAIIQILLADLGMSLDNILAVAGAARGHFWLLAVGLLLSVVLMGAAATAAAKMMHRWPWLGWIGLIVIVWVAGNMIWDGIEKLDIDFD